MSDEVITPAADSGAGATTIVEAPVTPAPGAAPTEATKPADTATVLSGGEGVIDPSVAGPVTWPDDWREKLAGEDAKYLAHLKRYASPSDYAKAGYEAQQKIRSGTGKSEMPGPDAAPEAVAAWRKEHGIPETPDGYEVKLSTGVVPGEQDKPAIDSFRAFALTQNMKPTDFNRVLDWYYAEQEQMVARQQQADAALRTNATDELRMEWGGEFRSNVNAMKNFLAATADEDLANNLLGARLANGNLLGNDPSALRWMVNLARDQMPGAALVPSGTPNIGKGVTDRIAELNKLISDRSSEYYKGPNSANLQKEYLDLLTAQEKMKARAA